MSRNLAQTPKMLHLKKKKTEQIMAVHIECICKIEFATMSLTSYKLPDNLPMVLEWSAACDGGERVPCQILLRHIYLAPIARDLSPKFLFLLFEVLNDKSLSL